MTPREHTAQRDLVAASVRSDDARRAQREGFAVQGRETGRIAVQTMRYRPRLYMAAARVYAHAQTRQRWS